VFTSQVIRHMGVECNKLGEECESRNEIHERGIYMGWDISRRRDDSRRGEEIYIGDGAAMEGKFWSVIGV
jgi:hypothetical protein